ncbi:MAG: hypothetical protein H6645_05385 [Caldilineaceae bacterium]|nr:hypothetical protein [Caldilineaceae bacterium]
MTVISGALTPAGQQRQPCRRRRDFILEQMFQAGAINYRMPWVHPSGAATCRRTTHMARSVTPFRLGSNSFNGVLVIHRTFLELPQHDARRSKNIMNVYGAGVKFTGQ